MSAILSYPRSGNHLARFLIELLSEKPTLGCLGNPNDISLYQNTYSEEIPFNINDTTYSDCFIKYHSVPTDKIERLIFIIRNPREVLLRHHNYNMCFSKQNCDSFDLYFELIDYFLGFKGDKLLLFYEDLIENREESTNKIYRFLNIDKKEKLNYVIENIEKLYTLSGTATNRGWGGINSDSINYYYKRLNGNKKISFDNYIQSKLENNNYKFIVEKYKL